MECPSDIGLERLREPWHGCLPSAPTLPVSAPRPSHFFLSGCTDRRHGGHMCGDMVDGLCVSFG
ncbi:hypothetical protein AvCA_09090 [Azotobacter vinelandii CA]|uniref:Uncharacterized protein n=2 Tax=Azotobacter vinelandii TaxID=354 RepID=C1DMW8_AZOVD|nr:hypothetical protein Avin_09090 [Azotobacter vinelandii DJ]AGK15472.1 hypothetical protein AvCA_09090 [Azotobacter vinelandii CA]AGK19588.1 hypothetical protein AvCA6_09090 [Azotobacter vinelandii CA6]